MKSKHQDRTLQTSCKDCVFAAYEGKTQVGCEAGRIESFMEDDYVIWAYDDEKEFYVVDALCNYFRPPTWNGGIPDVEKASYESRPSFSFVISADGVTRKKADKTKQSILSIDYPPDKMRAIVSQKVTASVKERRLVADLWQDLDRHGIAAGVVMAVSDSLGKYDALKKAKSSYFTNIKMGQKINPDLMSIIDVELNKKLNRVAFFQDGDINMVSYAVFVAGYRDYHDYDELESDVKKEAKNKSLYSNVAQLRGK